MCTEDALRKLMPRPEDLPERYRAFTPIEQRHWLVDGQLVPWDGAMRTIVSPVEVMGPDGPVALVLGRVPELTPECGRTATVAATKAYANGRGLWPCMRVADRIRHVEDFTARMAAKRQEVSELLMLEIGKSLADSYGEFDRTVEYIRDTLDALKDLDRSASRFVIEKGIYAQIRRAPLGPVLCMGPYNYPLNETFATLIPALVMGNPVIIKAPRQGKLLYSPLIEAFKEAFPPGVANILYGDRSVVKPIIESGDINVLAFIGTSKAADAMRVSHPHPHRLRCVLGLDAKNAAIVTDSADLDMAASEVAAGSLSFNGQRCTAIKIVFVHSSVAEDFLARLCAAVEKMPLGMPWEDKVKITPLPVPGKVDYLKGLIEDAKAQEARVINPGGGTSCGNLFFPAIVYPVNDRTRLWREEQFGPVVPVATFDHLEEPLRYVIESNFGQQVAIFSTDPDAVSMLTDTLVNQVCRVNINSQCQRGPDAFPFTGRKDSAEGTLSVSDALRCFSIRTLAAAKGTDSNKALLSYIVTKRKSTFLSTDFIF